MKRVLHVVGGMPKAGAETMIMNIYRNIDRTKYQFDFLLFSAKNNAYNDEIKNLGGRLFVIERGRKVPLLMQIWKTYLILKAHPEISVVQAHTLHNIPFSLIGAWFAGVKIRIAHSHNTKDLNSKSFIGRMYHKFSCSLIKLFANKYLTCGIAAGQYLFPSVSDKKVDVLYNAVELSKFQKHYDTTYLDTELNLAPHELILLQIGRITEEKNHIFSLMLISQLVKIGIPVKIIFAGVGELESKLKKKATALKIDSNVIFAGLRNDIPQLLQRSSVVLLPSHFEGFPVVLIEAQASRKPCLVSNKISREVDLEIDLLSFLPINNLDVWVNRIAHFYSNEPPQVSFQKIKKTFYDYELTLDSTIPKICKYYDNKL